MNTLFEKAFETYKAMLLLHMDSKTLDNDFHQATEVFYGGLFDIAHEVWEKYVDLWSHHETSDILTKKQQAVWLIASLRKDMEQYVQDNDITLGTEDMLGSLANKLEDLEWTAKSFVV